MLKKCSSNFTKISHDKPDYVIQRERDYYIIKYPILPLPSATKAT